MQFVAAGSADVLRPAERSLSNLSYGVIKFFDEPSAGGVTSLVVPAMRFACVSHGFF